MNGFSERELHLPWLDELSAATGGRSGLKTDKSPCMLFQWWLVL